MTTIFEEPRISPPNPYTLELHPLRAGPLSETQIESLLQSVNDSLRPWTAIWNLWDGFFTTVVHSPTHTQHLDFIRAVRAHPPTQPRSKGAPRYLGSFIDTDGAILWSGLPGFAAQWGDTHGVIEARRDWVGSVGGGGGGGGEGSSWTSYATVHLRFCAFSAALLKSMGPTGGVHPILVFYEARNMLERDVPADNDRREGRLAPRDLRDLDVRTTAIWIRDGAERLWDVNPRDLREHWAATLDSATELWPSTTGLTWERWRLWLKRLRELGRDAGINDETKCVLGQAAQVLEDLVGRG